MLLLGKGFQRCRSVLLLTLLLLLRAHEFGAGCAQQQRPNDAAERQAREVTLCKHIMLYHAVGSKKHGPL